MLQAFFLKEFSAMRKKYPSLKADYEALFENKRKHVAYITFWQRVNYFGVDKEEAILKKDIKAVVVNRYNYLVGTRKKQGTACVSLTTFRRRLRLGIPVTRAISAARMPRRSF